MPMTFRLPGTRVVLGHPFSRDRVGYQAISWLLQSAMILVGMTKKAEADVQVYGVSGPDYAANVEFNGISLDYIKSFPSKMEGSGAAIVDSTIPLINATESTPCDAGAGRYITLYQNPGVQNSTISGFVLNAIYSICDKAKKDLTGLLITTAFLCGGAFGVGVDSTYYWLRKNKLKIDDSQRSKVISALLGAASCTLYCCFVFSPDTFRGLESGTDSYINLTGSAFGAVVSLVVPDVIRMMVLRPISKTACYRNMRANLFGETHFQKLTGSGASYGTPENLQLPLAHHSAQEDQRNVHAL